ncbi:TIGR01458 family HAD-type hydrolase [Robbsia andropogonis]|uniref:TIGR01458 family HAD-type hydrolase n=1 Tax=Robbsia andropogonis TaxID=28092 RepID=UPI0004B8939E|nr:TIGR01458 family HAD-type hydrolase [Robbsia andropogonis]MCP1120868.1 TIGR01458 family HAD-type hydrolase [Robbsia andropogonis]MCP1130670.1 TIGR01458 family HAD-type hydrolase [Robbsia andropogonis]
MMRFDTLLSDIDGTLLHKGKALPGAAEALKRIRDTGMKVRLLTNTTAKAPAVLAAELCSLGIEAAAAEIETATTACVTYLQQQTGQRCHLIVPPDIRPLFDGVMINDERPDIVVIGDIGDAFDYATLNRAFRMLRDGARLVALQKNLFWFDRDGARLDCGAFIVGLEAAASVTALVTGKPSPVFFENALRQLNSRAERTLIVGDDVLTDMAGARAVGAHALLVKTGKFQEALLARHRAQVDSVIDSFADLPGWLASLAAV